MKQTTAPRISVSADVTTEQNDDHTRRVRGKHLDLWEIRRKPTPRANALPIEAFIIYSDSPTPGSDDYLTDPDRSTLRLSTGYPLEAYL
jgi:hypothetical protein